MKKRELTLEVFNSFEAADKAEREYQWSLTPDERWEEIEQIRQTLYGYTTEDDIKHAPLRRLQRFFEVVKLEPR
jgi:hypothetical protein